MTGVLEMLPRESAVIAALGEADPGMLSLADIADIAGGHVAGYGPVIASLRARRLVARESLGHDPRAAVYRLLPVGRRAYGELKGVLSLHALNRQIADRAPSVSGRAT